MKKVSKDFAIFQFPANKPIEMRHFMEGASVPQVHIIYCDISIVANIESFSHNVVYMMYINNLCLKSLDGVVLMI